MTHLSTVHGSPSPVQEVPSGKPAQTSAIVVVVIVLVVTAVVVVEPITVVVDGFVVDVAVTEVVVEPSDVVDVVEGLVVEVVVESTDVVDVVEGCVVVVGATVVDGTSVVLDVVVVGAGHRQLSSHTPPPEQPLRPGGSQSSPLDTMPSPHRTSQLVPPSLQQVRQSDRTSPQLLTASRKTRRAAFTHWRFAAPVPMHFALSSLNAALEAARQPLRSTLQLLLHGSLAAAPCPGSPTIEPPARTNAIVTMRLATISCPPGSSIGRLLWS